MNDKAHFFFSRLPKRLLQSHTLLDRNDRELLTQIIAWHPNDCFYSVDYFTETILGIGDKAFYRSLYKLQFLGLIKIKKGNRKRPNHYSFVDDPRLWRLPKELGEAIATDYQKLGLGTLEYQIGNFPNEYGFKLAFNSAYPKYPIKIKEREAPQEKQPFDEKAFKENLSPQDKKFYERFYFLNSVHISNPKIIADYYQAKKNIAEAIGKSSTDLAEYERRYYLTLEAKFFEVANNPQDEITRSLLGFAINLENKSLTNEEIFLEIRNETRRLRESENN